MRASGAGQERISWCPLSPEALRILLVTNLYPPQELGGYGRCMSDFCWGLQQRGHHVQVVTSDAPYLGDNSSTGPSHEPVDRRLRLMGSFEDGLSIIHDASAKRSISQWNQQLLTERMSQGWDGVLVGNLDLLGPSVLHPLMKQSLPVLHHVGFVHPPYPAHDRPHSHRYQLLSASHAVRDALIKAGFPVREDSVVYPGARSDLLGSSITGRQLPAPLNDWIPLPERLGTAKHPLKVCFAGLLMGSKGAHTLIQALIELNKRGVTVQATLAGSPYQPDYQERLVKVLQNHQLDNSVLFTGNLSRPALARMLVLHHIGVFPSIHPEAFGIVGAEMQLSGLALVSSGAGGAAELVTHGRTGLRFQADQPDDLANQLQLLADDPALLRSLARAGRQEALKKFSVESSCLRLEQLLNE